jgi:hypothetical protein
VAPQPYSFGVYPWACRDDRAEVFHFGGECTRRDPPSARNVADIVVAEMGRMLD